VQDILSSPLAQSVFAEYLERERREEPQFEAERSRAGRVDLDAYLLAIGHDVAALVHTMIVARKPEFILELGTSYGYSTLVLADAANQVGATVVTVDLAAEKQEYAAAMLSKAELASVVKFHCGDAVDYLIDRHERIDFVLLDIWKERYLACLQAIHPLLAEEGIIVADNAITPEVSRPAIREYRAGIEALADISSTLLPIGQGIEVSVRWTPGNPKL